MKKLIYIVLFAIATAVSCKPEAYTGPLDSPVGNWDGVRSEYFFNGENVANLDSCQTKAISFYKQGLCCIEGVKGAFPYSYDNPTKTLQLDSTIWEVSVLTGAEMVMTYMYRLVPETAAVPCATEETGDTEVPEGSEAPEVPEVTPDANGVILPAEYNGCTIYSDTYGYYYISSTGENVYCEFKGWKDPEGNLTIDFWFDRHTDHFIPLVVEPVKK